MTDIRLHGRRRVEKIGWMDKGRTLVAFRKAGDPEAFVEYAPVEEWERLPKAGPRRIEE